MAQMWSVLGNIMWAPETMCTVLLLDILIYKYHFGPLLNMLLKSVGCVWILLLSEYLSVRNRNVLKSLIVIDMYISPSRYFYIFLLCFFCFYVFWVNILGTSQYRIVIFYWINFYNYEISLFSSSDTFLFQSLLCFILYKYSSFSFFIFLMGVLMFV